MSKRQSVGANPLSADGLTSFGVFAEVLNFTRAAEVLHISQPSLNIKIRKLARAIGVPLYQREGRRLVLTPAGESLAAFAREQALREERLIATLRGRSAEAPLRLAAGEGALRYVLDAGLKRFLNRPRRALQIVTADAESAVDLVRSGRAEIGAAVLDEDPQDLTVVPIRTVGHLLVTPRTHPLADRHSVALDALDGEALVVPPLGRPHRLMLGRLLRASGVRWTPAVEVGGWELMVRMVELGFGVAVVNDVVRVPATLAAVPLTGLPPVRYVLVHRPELDDDPRVVTFVEACQS